MSDSKSAQAPPGQPSVKPADKADELGSPNAAAEASPTQAGEDGPIEVPKVVHLRIVKNYVGAPEKAFGLACGFQCALFLLFVVLILGVGSDFLNMSTGAALHLWKNKWKIRIDALTEGEKICSTMMLSDGTQLQQQESRIPAGEKSYTLGITYNAKDGNILTQDKLLKIKEVEDFIANHADYSKYCLRDSDTLECKEPLSVIRACVPKNCGYVQNLANASGESPTGCGARLADGSTPATDCSGLKSYQSGLFQCTKPEGCSRSEWTISSDFIETKTTGYAAASFGADYPETNFLAMVDTQFGSGSTSASALLSTFQFGFPLEGYSSTTDRADEQVEKVEDFLLDAYFDYLEEYNDDNDDGPFNIGYLGGGMLDASVQKLMTGDFALVFSAFLVVWLYVMFMTGSIFLSTMAMLQIFLCFGSGFFVYRIIYGNFFSTFHIMAIFLLVGVGVDNVFVFLDHYQAALQAHDSYLEDDWGRMSWTWKHAGIAMGVTSGTTTTSFLMNATSSFPGIEAFGIFAGCLCIVLYISMMFFWPAVVSFNQAKFKHRPFCCGCLQVCAKVVPASVLANLGQMDEAEVKETDVDPESGSSSNKKEVPKPTLVRFFEDHFSYFILNFRLRILLVFAGVIVVICTQIVKLEAAKKEPDMLPDTHPLMQYSSVLSSKFLRGGGTSTTQVKLAFGFAQEPLDKEGTDNSGTGGGEDTDTVGILGTVKWNSNFVNSSGLPNTNLILESFDCFIQLCDSAEVKDTARNTGGAPAYTMEGCFPRDVKEYLQTNDPANWETRWANIKAGDEADLSSVITVLLADDTWASEFTEHTFAEQVEGEKPFVRYFVADLRLTSTKDIGWEAGNDLAAAWEAWLASEMGKDECAAVGDKFWPFIVADDFHSFKVSETLMTEMFSGVMVSIIVALVVLVVVTGNIITGTIAALTIAMIVMCVMAIIPMLGWTLGMIECIALVMVPGLSVDFTAHLAESYNQAHYDNREHRVIHALEHSGVSIVSGSVSTCLAALCLLNCKIAFFSRFGILLLFTIGFAVIFSLFFFPSVMCLIGPVGTQGDWHKYLSPLLQFDFEGTKVLRIQANKRLGDGSVVHATRSRSKEHNQP